VVRLIKRGRTLWLEHVMQIDEKRIPKSIGMENNRQEN
jgi:hypothetical protein